MSEQPNLLSAPNLARKQTTAYSDRRILDLLRIQIPIIRAAVLVIATPAIVGVAEAGRLDALSLTPHESKPRYPERPSP